MSFFDEFIETIFPVFFTVISVVSIGLILALPILVPMNCRQYSEVQELEGYEFKFISGCYVRTEGEWMHKDIYEIRKAAESGLKSISGK